MLCRKNFEEQKYTKGPSKEIIMTEIRHQFEIELSVMKYKLKKKAFRENLQAMGAQLEEVKKKHKEDMEEQKKDLEEKYSQLIQEKQLAHDTKVGSLSE